MKTAALRELIQRAHQHEADSANLANLLEQKMPELHHTIRLPEGDGKQALVRFVKAYIDQVPDILDAANQVARDAGIEGQIKPVLKVAEAFFLEPSALMDGHEGLDGMLDEAYLAHRLVEEVNDRYITHLGQPLIPLDTTLANVIAHQLIGEPFANELDEVVHRAVDGMLEASIFEQESVQAYRSRLSNPSTHAAWKKWPCFSQQLGVELRL